MTEPTFLADTRASYDTLAAEYARRFDTALADLPLERAVLAAFAELVRGDGAGPVADVGCGPGQVTAHLHRLGLAVSGIDLSPRMVALAREAYPDLRFAEGSMTALDLADGSVAGVTALFSTIHTPPERLPGVFAEFHRVLAPGGHLLLAILVGDERRHRTDVFGHTVSLDYYLREPEPVAALLATAGLGVRARLRREPEEGETLPRGFLLARKPVRNPADNGRL